MTQFRARAGTYNASDMTSTYAIEGYPIQADQRNYPWLIATPSELFREFDAQTRGGLDGTVRNIGRWNGSWHFGALTPLMFAYVQTTLFPTNGVNEALTLVTYTAKRGWVCLNVQAHLLEPADYGTTKPRGQLLTNVRLIDFTEGVEADSGGAYSSAFSNAYDIGGVS
jgi:hypothetical protein